MHHKFLFMSVACYLHALPLSTSPVQRSIFFERLAQHGGRSYQCRLTQDYAHPRQDTACYSDQRQSHEATTSLQIRTWNNTSNCRPVFHRTCGPCRCVPGTVIIAGETGL